MINSRPIAIKIRVSEDEKNKIINRMKSLSITNMSAYVRKIAIDGMIVNLNISELKELSGLMRRISNNINQIAKKVNSTGSIYKSEIDTILSNQEELWNLYSKILKQLLRIS
jgi:hypothetical protein